MQKIFRPSSKSFKIPLCQELPLSSLEELTMQYASKSGSSYYYTKLGMYQYQIIGVD
jgi:hypothetical protein